MALQQITVRGFKSIRELTMQLGPLNVLIGANGAGKSNFIGVFRLLNELSEQNLQAFVARSGGAEAFLHFGSKVTNAIYFNLDDGTNGYAASLEPNTENGFIFQDEQAIFHGDFAEKTYSLGSAHRETKLIDRASTLPVADYTLKRMKTWKVYHFHDTSETARVKLVGNINDNATFRSNGENLAAFLFLLKKRFPSNYEQIVNAVRLAAPFFRDFILRSDPLNEEKIRLEWSERASNAYLNAHALSDGTLRFICLATLLLQPNLPATILIDEPELGLHPSAIKTLTELFRSASQYTQLIVSTQSVPLVNQLFPEEIVVTDRVNDQSTFRRLTTEEIAPWINEYALGDLWEKNVFGGRP